jgi:hypothetical protein
MLVSLTQAKSHLRVDGSAEDTHITLLVRAASASVIEYIRSGADAFTDSAGDVIVDSAGDPEGIPENVQVATLILIGYFYRWRDENKDFERGYLPQPVTALLTPYRDPVLR